MLTSYLPECLLFCFFFPAFLPPSNSGNAANLNFFVFRLNRYKQSEMKLLIMVANALELGPD